MEYWAKVSTWVNELENFLPLVQSKNKRVGEYTCVTPKRRVQRRASYGDGNARFSGGNLCFEAFQSLYDGTVVLTQTRRLEERRFALMHLKKLPHV